MTKMSPIFKITFSALFIALGIVLSRFASLPGLFGLPFLKISISPAIVMFSSFYLGPIYGLAVGTLTDVLGALLFPTGAFNPLYTIAASLTGLIPFLAYWLLRKIKIEDKFPFIGASLSILFTIGLIIFCSLNDSITSESGKTTYQITTGMKFGLCITAICLTAALIVLCIFLPRIFKKRKFAKYYNINLIVSSVFITYFLFKIPVGSLVQSILLEWDFLVILLVRTMTGFITSFVQITIITIALDVSLHFNLKGSLIEIKREEVKENSWVLQGFCKYSTLNYNF